MTRAPCSERPTAFKPSGCIRYQGLQNQHQTRLHRRKPRACPFRPRPSKSTPRRCDSARLSVVASVSGASVSSQALSRVNHCSSEVDPSQPSRRASSDSCGWQNAARRLSQLFLLWLSAQSTSAGWPEDNAGRYPKQPVQRRRSSHRQVYS